MLREHHPGTKVPRGGEAALATIPGFATIQPADLEVWELWTRKAGGARTHRNGTRPYAESWKEVLNAGSPGARDSIWVGAE